MKKIVFWKYENQCYLRSQFPPIFAWKQMIKHVFIILAFSSTAPLRRTWDSNLRTLIRLQSSLFPRIVLFGVLDLVPFPLTPNDSSEFESVSSGEYNDPSLV